MNDLWLAEAKESLRDIGYAVIPKVLSPDMLKKTREQMREVQAKILSEVGRERLDRANELGVLRLMMKYSTHFFDILNVPQVIQSVDHLLSKTAILHLQNGFILPSLKTKASKSVFQQTFHRDFPRQLGSMVSLNVFFAIDDFTEDNGSTIIVPGSHQRIDRPTEEYMIKNGVPMLCEAGP